MRAACQYSLLLSPTNANDRKTQELVDLVKESRSVFSSFAKAKSAKLGMSLSYEPLRLRPYPPANTVT